MIRKLRKGWGRFRGEHATGCGPGVNGLLKSTTTAIVWDGTSIRQVQTAILHGNAVSSDVFESTQALAKHVTSLGAECTALRMSLRSEKGCSFWRKGGSVKALSPWLVGWYWH